MKSYALAHDDSHISVQQKMKNFRVIVSLIVLKSVILPFSQSTTLPTASGDADTLIAVQVIFRHGARSFTETFPSDPYNNESYWPNGIAQLTCLGKLQCFNLGKVMRERYGDYVDPTYVKKQIEVISSDVDRTIQSAESVLAGFYSLRSEDVVDNCYNIPWTDVPIHTIPINVDNIIRQESPCPRYDALLDNVRVNTFQDFLKTGSGAADLNYFETEAKIPSDTYFLSLIKYYDALQVENYFNMTLPEWAHNVLGFESMKEVFKRYFQINTATNDMTRLRVGPLLDRLVKNFKTSLDLSEKIEQKMMHFFSGHDQTIVAFLDTLRIYKGDHYHQPLFASAIVLELHKTDRQIDIKLLYKNDTDVDTFHELEIPNCGAPPCSYSTFLSLISQFQLTNDEWLGECQQLSLIDPIEIGWTWTSLLCVLGFVLLAVVVITAKLTSRKIKTRQSSYIRVL